MIRFSIKQLMDNGVHYGHNTRRWHPAMEPYIYGSYNGIHIIDLQKTVPLFSRALEAISRVITNGGRILFVGTKKQARDIIKEYAEKSGQYYVNHRWLGGFLTNWNTVSASIKKLDSLDQLIDEGLQGFTKKESLKIMKNRDKLQNTLGGIRNMTRTPDLIFIIDLVKEEIALKEAKKLGIPIVAVVDTNANPQEIDFPIPGNDDALKSIRLYCGLVYQAILNGLEEEAKMYNNEASPQKQEDTQDTEVQQESSVSDVMEEAAKEVGESTTSTATLEAEK